MCTGPCADTAYSLKALYRQGEKQCEAKPVAGGYLRCCHGVVILVPAGRELTDRDRWICEQVGPTLKRKGLYFVGLDVIGDYLTEINVTSPTCVRELDRSSASTSPDSCSTPCWN